MPMMTMPEFLKTEAPAPDRAVTKLFVEEGRLFRAMPFETVAQAGVPYNKQTGLPSTAARAVGETYTPSVGTVEPGFEAMKLYGGLAQFDAFQVATGSGSRRAIEVASKVESAVRNFTADVIKGDSTSDPRVVNGLANRLTDTTKNHYAPGVGAATITRGLAAKKMARKPTHIIVGEGIHNRFSVAAHNTAVGGYITRSKDALGEEVMVLFGLPVIVIERDEADAEILDFTEASSSTSIYFVSFGPDMMHGVQVNFPRAEDLGRDPSNGTQWNTLVDWYATFMLRHDRAAVRWSGITDAAVTL